MVATKKISRKKIEVINFDDQLKPSVSLAKIIGKAKIDRASALKKVWEYIHKNGCQSSKDETVLIVDETLKYIFSKKRKVSIFELPNVLNEHLS